MVDLSELGAGSLGIWTRAEALEVLGRGSIQARVRSGEWQQLFPGVYADGGIALTAEQWALAAVLATRSTEAGARVVACLRSAARVWGLALIDDDDPATGAAEAGWHEVATQSLHGTVWCGSRRVLRHRLSFQPEDLVRLPSGLWVTTALRTALDCAAALPLDAAVCLLDNGLRRRLFTPAQLQAGVTARRGQPRVRRLSRAVALADARAESSLETLARLLLLPVLPKLVPQVRLRDDCDEVVARFDLGDEQARFAVETDGKRWHSGARMVAKDRARDRLTEAFGWRTERVTWFEVRCQQTAVVRRVLAQHALHVAKAAEATEAAGAA